MWMLLIGDPMPSSDPDVNLFFGSSVLWGRRVALCDHSSGHSREFVGRRATEQSVPLAWLDAARSDHRAWIPQSPPQLPPFRRGPHHVPVGAAMGSARGTPNSFRGVRLDAHRIQFAGFDGFEAWLNSCWVPRIAGVDPKRGMKIGPGGLLRSTARQPIRSGAQRTHGGTLADGCAVWRGVLVRGHEPPSTPAGWGRALGVDVRCFWGSPSPHTC